MIETAPAKFTETPLKEIRPLLVVKLLARFKLPALIPVSEMPFTALIFAPLAKLTVLTGLRIFKITESADVMVASLEKLIELVCAPVA